MNEKNIDNYVKYLQVLFPKEEICGFTFVEVKLVFLKKPNPTYQNTIVNENLVLENLIILSFVGVSLLLFHFYFNL